MSRTVQIVADQPVIGRAIRLALQAAGSQVVGDGSTGNEAVEFAVAVSPDVVVVAWTSPGPAELELLRRLRQVVPESKIVVRSSRPAVGAAAACLQAGADEHLDTTDLGDLVAAVVRHPCAVPDGHGTAASRVLVIDDDSTARRLLRLSIELEGGEVTEAGTMDEVRELVDQHFDGIVLDRRLPDGDGLDLLPLLAERHPRASVVVCSNVEDRAEPWFVLHVPKTDMESVVRALGLVRRDPLSAPLEASLGAPLPEIVRRWLTRLGGRLTNPPTAAAHDLVRQLVHALHRPWGSLDGRKSEPSNVDGDSDGRRLEVSVRQLVDLRELLTGEFGRQLSGDSRAGPLASVNRELDIWVLAAVARDVRRLRHEASTDALTGLANRRAFEEALSLEVARSCRYRRPFSVVMVDLDGLKAINDHEGHAAGDLALVEMAMAIRCSLRVNDCAYRVGGDEFVIMLPETPKGLVTDVIERVQAFSPPAFSWGASTFLEDSEDSATVIDLADQALLARRRANRAPAI